MSGVFPEPKAKPKVIDRTALAALEIKMIEYLGDSIYWCSRDHSAWPYGTMDLDDFTLASQEDDIVDSFVDIALEALGFVRPAPETEQTTPVAQKTKV